MQATRRCGMTFAATATLWSLCLTSTIVLVYPPLTSAFRIYELLDAVDKRDSDEWSTNLETAEESAAPLQLMMTSASSRQKRYTENQENAIAICSGDCMYSFRKTYSECYDLCDWSGRTPSPWRRFEKDQQLLQKSNSAVGQPSSPSSSIDAHHALIHRFGQRKPAASVAQTGTKSSSLTPVASAGGYVRGSTPVQSSSTSGSASTASHRSFTATSSGEDRPSTWNGRKITAAGRRKNPKNAAAAGSGGRRKTSKDASSSSRCTS